jgi:hypothetical protein
VKLAPIAKALTAAGVAFTGAGATAAVDGTISGYEWWTIAGATLAALALVWRVPNADAD